MPIIRVHQRALMNLCRVHIWWSEVSCYSVGDAFSTFGLPVRTRNILCRVAGFLALDLAEPINFPARFQQSFGLVELPYLGKLLIFRPSRQMLCFGNLQWTLRPCCLSRISVTCRLDDAQGLVYCVSGSLAHSLAGIKIRHQQEQCFRSPCSRLRRVCHESST